MSNATHTPAMGQESSPKYLDIAGYRATAGWHTLPGRILSKPGEELDRLSLEKLWHTGFDVASLDEAHEKWKISPLRSCQDIYTLLGHQKMPVNANGAARYDETSLTSLAIQYPSLLDPGEVYPHTKIIRIRYPQPIYTIRKQSKTASAGVEQRRYDQPVNQSEERSTSEPYFLYGTLQHSRLYDTSLPLLMTEGELKGCALGLAEFPAIAWGGVNMWVAPKKTGKNRIHPALDPDGPCKAWAVPVLGREIYLIPDTDYATNQNVRKAFTALGQELLRLGCGSVRMVLIPQPPRPDQWKGVDDYLTHHLGSRWSSSEKLVAQARDFVNILCKDHSRAVRQSGRYEATSVVRGADRMYDRLQDWSNYTAVLTGETYGGRSRIGWLTYDNDRYTLHHLDQSVGNTNGKVVVPHVGLQTMAEEEYETGVDLAMVEGDIKDKPSEMPTDYPNHLMAAVNRRLPERENDTLIERFGDVKDGDFLIRIDKALVNLTRFFDTGGGWTDRGHWLLPPNPRWFSTGCMNVTLGNLHKRPECPIFMDMIEHGFDGDQQSILALQLFLGKVIANPMFMGLQQFLALCGAAGGGKGTFSRLLIKLLGPQNVAFQRAQFGNRFDTATLPGKRLIVFQETPDGVTEHFSPYMAELIKCVTGQDTIVYEKKGFDARAINLNADVMTVGNDPPIIPMNAEAFRRRVVLLQMFNPLKERDPRVERQMSMYELPGIFMWGLEGAMKLANGTPFRTPDRNAEDLDDVTASVAPEERYVATQFKMAANKDIEKHRLSTEAIYDHYQAWVRQHQGKVNQVGVKRLGHLLRKHFPMAKSKVGLNKDTKKSYRYYEGLMFINPLY